MVGSAWEAQNAGLRWVSSEIKLQKSLKQILVKVGGVDGFLRRL